MSTVFRVGQQIDPSGFGMAVIDVPALDPEQNISLIDKSHLWEENVSSPDTVYVRSYVAADGNMPNTTMNSFVITNSMTSSTGDTRTYPLYYRHKCRFHHYTYGQATDKQIYITDSNGNTVKSTNYKVMVRRVLKNVYSVDIHTSFMNSESSTYRVKYNRCMADGSQLHAGWVENLNSFPLFNIGDPTLYNDQYSSVTSDITGLTQVTVPPVPHHTDPVNLIGVSFLNAPTIVRKEVLNSPSSYSSGVIVTYTLVATGPTTFTIQRDKTRTGTVSATYLQSTSTDTWSASPHNFTIGVEINSILGLSLLVVGDQYLTTGDSSIFTASRSFYTMIPTSYSTIHLSKPHHVDVNDDWYLKVKNGQFRRRMFSNGQVAPSGAVGASLMEYSVPEYQYQIWYTAYGAPYVGILNERADVLSEKSLQLRNTPMFVDQTRVFENPTDPGFPPSGILSIYINNEYVPQSSILDWDAANGVVTVDRTVTQRDGIAVSYVYREDYVEYPGFAGSGGVHPTNPTTLNPFQPLDLNPTPQHNYWMYASGVAAYMFLRPFASIDESTGVKTTLNTETLYHNTTGTPVSPLDFNIGSVSVGPNCRVSDVKVTDVRNRGGGLSKIAVKDLENVAKVQPETEFFWDVGYFDGQAVPTNGVIIVRVPRYVLKSAGGRFNEDEVRQKVLKHMPLGGYPIIEYVDELGYEIILEDGRYTLVDTFDGLLTEG
jgi:hypothetical protein